MKTKKTTRYFIDRDEDGHWYIIKESGREEWRKWNDTYYEGERPACVSEIGGNPNLITFSNPQHKYE